MLPCFQTLDMNLCTQVATPCPRYVQMGLHYYMGRHHLFVNIEGEFESIAIEVKDTYDKQNAIIADIYRVPNTNERKSIERYDEFVTKFCQTKMDVLDVFFTTGVLPTVRRSTRTNATVIDNIYMKCAGYDNIDSKIMMTDIPDHYPIIDCMGVTKESNIKQPLVFECIALGQPQIYILSAALTNTVRNDYMYL